MTELERETILAERRRKLDLLQEHRELKARIGQKLGRRTSERKKDSRKELEKLKKKRQKKAQKAIQEEESLDEDDEEEAEDESDRDSYYYEDDDDQDQAYQDKKTVKADATFEEILTIQVKRTDLEQWALAPFFQTAIRGDLTFSPIF